MQNDACLTPEHCFHIHLLREESFSVLKFFVFIVALLETPPYLCLRVEWVCFPFRKVLSCCNNVSDMLSLWQISNTVPQEVCFTTSALEIDCKIWCKAIGQQKCASYSVQTLCGRWVEVSDTGLQHCLLLFPTHTSWSSSRTEWRRWTEWRGWRWQPRSVSHQEEHCYLWWRTDTFSSAFKTNSSYLVSSSAETLCALHLATANPFINDWCYCRPLHRYT